MQPQQHHVSRPEPSVWISWHLQIMDSFYIRFQWFLSPESRFHAHIHRIYRPNPSVETQTFKVNQIGLKKLWSEVSGVIIVELFNTSSLCSHVITLSDDEQRHERSDSSSPVPPGVCVGLRWRERAGHVTRLVTARGVWTAAEWLQWERERRRCVAAMMATFCPRQNASVSAPSLRATLFICKTDFG